MEKGKVKRKEKEKEMTRQQKPFAQFISLSKTKKKKGNYIKFICDLARIHIACMHVV